MRYLALLIVLVILHLCACEAPNQQPRVTTSDATILSSEEEYIPCGLDSAGQVKRLVFTLLQTHELDTAYHRFMFLNDTISESYYQVEIYIGHLFHPSLKSAVLSWAVTDTTMDIVVFDLDDQGNRIPRFVARDQPSIKLGIVLRGEFLFFKDYNFDGWKDLEVITEAWDGIANGHKSLLWLVRQGEFHPVRFFENIDSPQPDPIERQICSYNSGGCADMAMHFSVWKLQADSVKMTKDIDVDCCVGVDGKCLITIDDQASIPVPGNQVHRYVPRYYRDWIKEKMRL